MSDESWTSPISAAGPAADQEQHQKRYFRSRRICEVSSIRYSQLPERRFIHSSIFKPWEHRLRFLAATWIKQGELPIAKTDNPAAIRQPIPKTLRRKGFAVWPPRIAELHDPTGD